MQVFIMRADVMRRIEGYIFMDDGAFAPGRIYLEGGLIRSVERIPEVSLSPDEASVYVIPGLIDIHSHGCFGHDTCDADEEGLRAMIDFEVANGTTSYCPTTMTLDEERLKKACETVGKVAKEKGSIKGIYLEGPFISRKRCGAQNPEYIKKPDAGLIRRLDASSGGLVKVVTIAPEEDGAFECIENLSKDYIVSVAHTEADYDTAVEAFKRGASEVTHFYNAMPPYLHRAPGVIGAAMESDTVKIELIADGIHIHPAVVKNTFRYFGADRIILISDSMEATGMKDGKYTLGDTDVFVKERRATLKDGTIAGSASTLLDCVKCAVEMGVPKAEAIISATRTPAKKIGIFNTVGSITPGKKADILLTDDKLNLIEVICQGSPLLSVL